MGDEGIQVDGDPDHPANRGRLCSKGHALAETLGLENRLLHPRIDGRRVAWDQALDQVAGRFRQVIERHGPDAVAFYVSGQLLTEDYYVANKLMKGFIGSANIDTNSRLCMSSAVAGYKRAFGSDTVPCDYRDLETADLVTLVGSNAAWCHPVLFQRLRAAKAERPDMRIVVIDPRRTPTCDIADLHLPLRPGSDVSLFNTLLQYIDRSGRVDWPFVVNHTEGFGDALQAAGSHSDPVHVAAQACGLTEHAVQRFFQWFGATDKALTLYSQGVNQWAHGTDKVNAIINCHLATGRIGRPGAGPFSITGQPNAMGGREVGGLANQLAAHMDFQADDLDRVRRFWKAPRIARRPGLKAVDLFRAIEEGRVKALWVMATNPAVSAPDADRVRAALRACEFLVVSDCVEDTDTTACADVLLPAATWGEKSGSVTNSERRLSRQRAFLPPPGEARPDWWMITRVAQRMGFAEEFPYTGPAQIFREHAALTGFENQGARDLDLGGLAHLDDHSYESMEPIAWPCPQGADAPPRPFSDRRFFTPSGRARFIAVGPAAPANGVDGAFPLILNTGRLRDQWHTMTRTAKAARLTQHQPEPFVQLAPVDAEQHGLRDGGLARLRSRWGCMHARVRISDEQRPGSVFVPMHWSDAFGPSARVDALVNPAVDPISGQPEFKHTPVRVEPLRPAWSGFLLCRETPSFPDGLLYRVRVNGGDHLRFELAGEQEPRDWRTWARALLGEPGEWVEFQDAAEGRYRCARLSEGRLQACLFVERSETAPGRDWLGKLFASPSFDADQRADLLSGRPRDARAGTGRTLCTCFDVGIETLARAIREQGLATVEAVGEALRAGTNCGSCIPEIRGLLRDIGGGESAAA